jgi:hypothetical protein
MSARTEHSRLRGSEQRIKITRLAGKPSIDELRRIIREGAQESQLCLGVLDRLGVLMNLYDRD